MAFIPRDQLEKLGFARLGENVYISDKASIYNAANISIGSHVRIDDFCVLSAGAGSAVAASSCRGWCWKRVWPWVRSAW